MGRHKQDNSRIKPFTIKITEELYNLVQSLSVKDKADLICHVRNFVNSYIKNKIDPRDIESYNKLNKNVQHKKTKNKIVFKYNYIYIIQCYDKVYVGKHQTNDLNDGYLGSRGFC